MLHRDTLEETLNRQ